MAISPSLSSLSPPLPLQKLHSSNNHSMVTPIIFLFLFMAFSVSSISFLLISLWKTKKKPKHKEEERDHEHQRQKSSTPDKGSGFSLLRCSLSGKTHHSNPALVVEILTSAAGFHPKQQQSTGPPDSQPVYSVSAAPIDNRLKRILEKNQSLATTPTSATTASNGLELVLKVTHSHSRGADTDANADAYADADADAAVDADCDRVGDLRGGKKKKKRAKKKKQPHNSDKENQCGEEDENPPARLSKTVTTTQVEEDKLGCTCGIDRGDLHRVECLYPFTSSSSVLQRKIKQQYDELVKSNHAKTLTLAQVGQFANCLIEAKTALQHKSEIIQRRFTITKSLLFKADKSSFDRLCGQIYKLEMEQKRLEEDALVYNRLQEQIKLSPAYKKMLELGSHMELQASSEQLLETPDTEFADISFEELLAQEKKDSFWQKNGKLRSCAN